VNKLLKRTLVLTTAAVAFAGVTLPASAEEPKKTDQQMMQAVPGGGAPMPYGPGYGMGPGMMGGYGPGYGMGSGMMGGYGMGPGMMGGYGPGYGMGPGMMGYGMGPGMMGYGMGPGMMGGYGPGYGMGPGMMGGWAGLNLSDAQVEQVEKIHDKLQEKHRKLMGQMWEEQAKLANLYNAEKLDSAAIGKVHDKLAKLQREALEARIEAENKFADVLTKEQKAQLRRGWGRMGY
jgi:Spy/CpxP family protein refolding chaperone